MSLHQKIILLVIFIAGIGGATQSLLVSDIMTNMMHKELEAKALILTRLLEEQILEYIISDDVISATRTLHETIMQNEDIEYIYIEKLDGRVFAHTFKNGFPRAFANEKARENSKFHINKYFTERGPILDASLSLIAGSNAHFHVGINETQLYNNIRSTLVRIIIIALVIGSFGILIGIFISYRITSPLTKVMESIAEFGQGKIEKKLEYPKGAPEIVNMVSSFNKMIENLNTTTIRRRQAEKEIKTRQKEIEELNSNLERRVEEELKKNLQKDLIMTQQSRLAAMGEMIGNIAHQWKQPINALNILLCNINDLFLNEEQDKELFSSLIKKGDELIMKMSTTIDDFRYFFKPEKKKEQFSINKNIKDSLRLIHESLKYHNISVILNEESEIKAFGFSNEYSQVLLNIINNAKDAIDERGGAGEIKIDVLHENDFAIVRIKDNGGGISENSLKRIFDPYFTTKEEEKATGIGLYMSKVIIEEHMNGHIMAKNTEEGAEFEITLPMIQS